MKSNNVLNKNVSYAISWGNTILSFLIVLLHTDFSEYLYSAEDGALLKNTMALSGALADMAVPAFYLISAFLLFWNYKNIDYIALLKKKTRSVLIPYIIWSCAGFLYLLILKRENIVFTVSGIARTICLSTGNQPLWFLRALYVLILLSPILFRILKVGKVTICFVPISCIMFAFFDIGYSSALYWLPVYLLGAWCGIYYDEIINSHVLHKLKSLSITRVLIAAIGIVVIGGVCPRTE